jgi:uncharacterized protein YcbX
MHVGKVVEVWRYPVKSMGGEAVAQALVDTGGLAGDRHWAVIDGDAREIRSAKRWPELLGYCARYVGGRAPATDAYAAAVIPVEIVAPDGRTLHSAAADRDAELSAWVQRVVRLSPRAPAHDRDHYRLARARTPESTAAEMDLQAGEAPPDFSLMSDAAAVIMQDLADCATPPGSYVDAFPLHLLSRNALAWLSARSGLDTDVRRFRPNLLIDIDGAGAEPGEDAWIGWCLSIGEARLRIDSRTVRCAMPGRAQPRFGLAEQPTLARALVEHGRRQLGVNVIVEQAGVIRAGDPILRIG